ncbi:MAG: sugar ABC transporter substrate-binding protein [Clostridiaceae bacterium]|nr:sugar ABC transporter substrate-binding protein [Clostridiaceae bacterium]
MKKFGKKTIALLMSTLSCALLFSSCGNSSKRSTESTEKTTDPVTITFYTWEKTGYTEQQDNIVKAFEEKNKNIKVKFVYPTDNNNADYLQKMNTTLMSSNNDVDVFGASGASSVADFIKAGVMEPLDSYIKKEGVDFDKTYSYHFIVDNKTYAIPTFETTWFVMLNKKLLDEAALPVPALNWSWDDYRMYAKKLTSGTGKDKTYGSYMHSWPDYIKMGIYANNTSPLFYDKDKNLVVEKPMFKDWMKLRFDMETVDKSQVPYSDVKAMNLAYRTQFFNGKVGMLATGAWMVSEIQNVAKYPHEFATAFAPLPRFEDSKEGRTFGDSHYFGVSKNSKNKDAAYKFLRFYSENRSKIAPLTGFTGVKNQDKAKIVKELIGTNEKYYDMDSLIKVYNNPKFEVNYLKNSSDLSDVEKQTQDLVSQESEKYLMGAQALDKSIQNMLDGYKKIKK